MARTADRRIARVAARQLGLVTRTQGLCAGMSARAIDRRVSSRRWESVQVGVYRIAGAPASWEQLVLAACFGAGGAAVASHLTAATLWGIVERRDPPVEITAPIVKHPRPHGVRGHRSRIPLDDVRKVRGIPVTSPARTLADIAGVLTSDELEEALDAALRRRLVTIRELNGLIRQTSFRRRRGAGTLTKLLRARLGSATSESVFETRFLRALRRGGLPVPESQHEVRQAGRLIARVDLAYPRERIAIELDGLRDHSSRRAFDRDRVRQNELVQAGWTPLRFTWSDLGRPQRALDLIRRMLLERGYQGGVSV